jgi:hypothetical protein
MEWTARYFFSGQACVTAHLKWYCLHPTAIPMEVLLEPHERDEGLVERILQAEVDDRWSSHSGVQVVPN